MTTSSSTVTTAASVVAAAAMTVVCLVAYAKLGEKKQKVVVRTNSRRRLESSLSNSQLSGKQEDNDNDDKRRKEAEEGEEELTTMEPIGTVSSVYRLCVGTPRQGLLAPHARGWIDLDLARISGDAVLALEEYSHIWVIFLFHLNSNTAKLSGSSKSHPQQFPSKVAPPALGGAKVGVFSTRSPHRPNPIGMTLCQLDDIVRTDSSVRLLLSGLDLVDGTPVLDLKPYVGAYDSVLAPRVPAWVKDGLEKRRPVVFAPEAERALEEYVAANQLQFFGPSRDASTEKALAAARACLEQVLSVDVRSCWQTYKARQGQSQAERAGRLRNAMTEAPVEEETSLCTQQIDNLLIKFVVTPPPETEENSAKTAGSGAEDSVEVKAIELLQLQTNVAPATTETAPAEAADEEKKTQVDEEETETPIKPEEEATTTSRSIQPAEAPPEEAEEKKTEAASEAIVETTNETTVVPESETAVEPASETTVEPANETTVAPTTETTVEAPASETTAEATVETTPVLTTETVEEVKTAVSEKLTTEIVQETTMEVTDEQAIEVVAEDSTGKVEESPEAEVKTEEAVKEEPEPSTNEATKETTAAPPPQDAEEKKTEKEEEEVGVATPLDETAVSSVMMALEEKSVVSEMGMFHPEDDESVSSARSSTRRRPPPVRTSDTPRVNPAEIKEFSALKSYWSSAATRNTPSGLVPTEDPILKSNQSMLSDAKSVQSDAKSIHSET